MQPTKWAFPGGEKAHIGPNFPPRAIPTKGRPNWALGAHVGGPAAGFSPTLPG